MSPRPGATRCAVQGRGRAGQSRLARGCAWLEGSILAACISPSKQAASALHPPAPAALARARLRMAPAIAKQARKGRRQACAAVKPSPLRQQLTRARGEPGQGLGGRSCGAQGRSGEHLASVSLDLPLHLSGCLSGLEAPLLRPMVTPPGLPASAEALGAQAGTPHAEHPLPTPTDGLCHLAAFPAAPGGGAGTCSG